MDKQQIIDDLFNAFGLEGSKKHIEDFLYCALTGDDGEFEEGIQRANAILFADKLKKLLEVLYDGKLKGQKSQI
jgi:hypothetical protein